ncbi:cation diffusion facilitator family transporter [Aquirhabdus sp.]|uniref:cation diffusion facilitator family transporter n=1 Tax=Aquirhabdus sp. TaxID=2824160 RepID=UPI00396C70B2
MSGTHDHYHEFNTQNEGRLWWVLSITCIFLIAEVVGGIWTHSLALLSDAAHVSTDAAAIAIAIAAIRVGRRPADDQRTYGYYRFEILGVVLNALLLFAVAIYILYEAYLRLSNPPELHSTGMIFIALGGLIANLVCMKILTAGNDGSLNMKAAYLEVLADMVGSTGVIVGAVIIYFTQWAWVDSVVAIAIGLWVLPRTWVLMKQSVQILLESVPEHLDIKAIRDALTAIDGVESVHDLHVWSLTADKVSLTIHLVCPERSTQEVLEDAMDLLAKRFSIFHVAIQCEEHPCAMSRPETEHYQEHEVSVYDFSHHESKPEPHHHQH